MSLLGRQSPDERDEKLGGSRSGPALKEENVYIPQFITKRPFYAIDESEEGGAHDSALSAGGAATGTASRDGARDYLEHQRLRKQDEETVWYQRGKKAGPAATKYRKGACENCGAMGHKMRDCLSRPRSKTKMAKFSGEDIQADDLLQDVKLSWDAKRDRWLGFDARDYSTMMARKDKMTEAKRALQKKASGATDGADGDGADPGNEDTKYAEDADMGVSRTNGAADLRMREDTARYLVNLDLDSAKYDPKRRQIVSGGAFHDESAQLFAEQNFARASGEAAAFEKAERYAWEVHDQTGDASMHLQANPTAAAHRRKQEAEAAAKKRKEMAALMKDKYGVVDLEEGEEGDDVADKDAKSKAAGLAASASASASAHKKSKVSAAAALARTAASEHFVEYDESGHVKEKQQTNRADRSKYAEDVFPMNHTSVWGSWWNNFQWGYACCHSFVRNSYCTGEDGKAAWERAERQRLGDWGDEKEGGDDDDGDKGGDDEQTERKLLEAVAYRDDTRRDDDDEGESHRKKRRERTSRRD